MRKMNKRLISVLLSVLLVFTTLPVGALTVQADELSDAKAAYLSKVSEMYNGTKLYKNSIGAYMAYVDACKEGAGAEQAVALANATAAMQEFTPYTGTQTVKVNGTNAAGSYSNVLWAESPTGLQYSNLEHGYIYWSNGILKYGGDMFVYQPSAVVLYDGTTAAKVPVLFAEQENEGRYRFRYGYVAEAGGRLKTDWLGHNTAPRSSTSSAVNVVWPTSSSYSIPRVATTDSSSDDGYKYWDASDTSSSAGGHDANSDFYNFRNALTFDIDNGMDYTTITNKNEYKGIENYKKISKFEWTVHAYWYNVVTGSEHRAEGNTLLTTRNPVYVLNYKKLLDKIQLTLNEKKDSFLVDNDGFRSGNSVGFFGAFDYVLSLDLTDTSKYDYEADAENAVKKAGNDISEACNDLDEITSTAAAMSTLVNNINRYEAMMADNPYRYNLAETYRLYIKAKECFDAYMFGQKNDPDNDSEFLTYLASVSNAFDTALSAFTPFASYTVDGQGNKTFTANPIEGDYTPDTDTKIFEGDINGGAAGLATYKNAGAMNNVLYYPTVTRANGVRAETDTLGNGNHTYTVDGRSMPFNGDGDGTNHFTVYYPAETVLVYNGDSAPAFPVLSGIRNAHSTVGVENYTTAAYPTDSATLKEYNSRYLDDVDGYSSQKVNGVSYADGYYPFVKSTDSVTDVGLFGTKRYNVRDTNKGPRAPEESATFNIKAFSERYTYDNQYATNNKYWKGIHTERDSNNLPLSWVNAWNTDTSGITGSGAIYGSPTEWWSRYYDLKADDNHGKAEISIAASAVELVVNPFEGKTKSDGAEYYTANYNGPNWYHSFQEVRATTDLNVEIMLDKGSVIRVLNVIPAMDAKNNLVENNNVQDILGAIFQYDKDSADVISFLTALDKVGSFNPNNAKYDYSAATSGTPEYSVNAGIEQACKDMVELVNATDEALDYIDDSTDSEHSTVNDDKINTPTDATSKSTDTNDPGTGWYADLRRALIDPIEPDSCTDDEAYAEYKAVLDKAQDAVAYSATSKIGGGAGVDYEAEYNGQTIPEIAQELIEATETFKNAPAKHIFEYDDENENQISTWDCSANAAHNHSTADMSAYNELEIAYGTIDPEAYDNFESLVAAMYDGNAYDDSSEATKDYADLSFKEVKTKQTKKGDTPQNFVDTGVMNLLEAINIAATENQGEHLSTYKVNFNVQVAGEPLSQVIINQTYRYGDYPTLNAADSPVFNLYGCKCYKWSVKIGEGEERFIKTNTPTLSCAVQRDCTITAYANKAIADEQARIDIKGPTGATIDVVHAAKTASLAFSYDSENKKATVSIAGNNFDIASTTSYNVTGITLDGTDSEDYAGRSGLTVQGLLDELHRTSLVIRPLKTGAYGDGTYTINTNGTGGTVNRGNESGTESSLSGVAYDEKIRANYTPDASKGTYYGMVINESEMAGGTIPKYIPITYSDVYYFRAISNMNFYPLYQRELEGGAKAYYVDDGSADGIRITNADTVYRLQHKLPFVISFMDGIGVEGKVPNLPGKFSFRCAYTTGLPDNVKVTEAGWIYFYCHDDNVVTAVSALSPDESDLSVNNVKTVTDGTYTGNIIRQATTKLTDPSVVETHQYSFSSKDRDNTYILGRGYIKYQYTFSESATHDGNTTTVDAPIEAISYGRADFYMNPPSNS